jgi:hypothetical protein
MTGEDRIIGAIRAAADLIEETAREAGPMGIPSALVYAALSSAGMNLDTYTQILGAMELYGRIRREGDLIYAVDRNATVKRPDLWGAVNDTFQTEAELNGIRDSPGRLL